MSGAHFMPVWTDAYLGDTQHLTNSQHGSYWLILMTMWRNGGTLPNDEKRLARIVRLPLDKWRKTRREVMELFDVEGDVITQKRLKLELEKTLSLAEKRALAGKSGGRAKSLKNNDLRLASATANAEQKATLLSPTPTPAPTREEKVEDGGDDPLWQEVLAAGNRADQTAPAEPIATPTKPEKSYAFEDGVIRLTDADFAKWKQIYPSINLAMELASLSEWATSLKAEGRDWFHAVKAALAKKERTASEANRRMRIQAEVEAKAGATRQNKTSRPAI